MVRDPAGDTPYLRVLGSTVLVRRDGSEAEFTPIQQRLLARLVVAWPEPVHRDELADAVWGRDRPASARQALHNQVSRIRGIAGESSIETVGDRYLLALATDVDLVLQAVVRAEELLVALGAGGLSDPVDAGDPAVAASDDDHDATPAGARSAKPSAGHPAVQAAFDDIDALLGPAHREILADLDHGAEVTRFRQRAQTIVSAAENLRLEAALILGRRDWAVIEAQRLTQEAPLDERAAANYARALASAGRRSDALTTLARVRKELRLHLGFESGPLLDAAEAEILQGQVRPAEGSTYGSPPPLVGRRDELRRILQSVAQRRPVRVRGEHGAGVSRMLFEVRTRLVALGVRTVLARAEEHPHSATSLIEELLFELDVPRDPTQNAISAFASVAAAIDAAHPTVFIVDDVQFLGPSAWQALRAVAEAEFGGLVLGGHGHVLELDGEVEVRLEPLDHDEISAVARHSGVDDVGRLSRIADVSGGNPLAARLLAQSAEIVTHDADDAIVVPEFPAFADFLQRLVGDLGADRRHDLQLAAVAGDGYPVAAFDHVTWAHELELPDNLVETDARGSLRFRHGAVQAYIYRTLPRGVLLDLHHELGRAARAVGAPAGTVARHLLTAAELDPEAAIEAAREAAREASLLGAHADAAGWLAQARMIADAGAESASGIEATGVDTTGVPSAIGADPACGVPPASGVPAPARAGESAFGWDDAPVSGLGGRRHRDDVPDDAAPAPRSVALAIEHADALRLAGDPQHLEALIAATRYALACADDTLIAAAGFALLQLGGSSPAGGPDERITELTEQVMSAIDDPQLRAPVQAAASLAWSMTGHADKARLLFDEAESAAIDPAVRLAVLPFAYLAVGRPCDLPRRAALAAELVATARAAGEPVSLWEGLHLSFSVAIQQGDGAAMRAALAEMERLIDRIGDVGRRWSMLYCAATLAEIDGDYPRCELLAAQAHSVFSPVSPDRAGAALYGQLLPLRLRQGRLAEVRPVIEQMVAAQPGVTAWHAAAALVKADALSRAPDAAGAASPEADGGHDAVREEARAHAERALQLAQDDFLWLAAHVVGGRAAAQLGEADLVERYAARLRPWADLVCWQGTCSYGPVAAVLALLAEASGDRAAARDYTKIAERLTRSLTEASIPARIVSAPSQRSAVVAAGSDR